LGCFGWFWLVLVLVNFGGFWWFLVDSDRVWFFLVGILVDI
jgi:hypothetical protein